MSAVSLAAALDWARAPQTKSAWVFSVRYVRDAEPHPAHRDQRPERRCFFSRPHRPRRAEPGHGGRRRDADVDPRAR